MRVGTLRLWRAFLNIIREWDQQHLVGCTQLGVWKRLVFSADQKKRENQRKERRKASGMGRNRYILDQTAFLENAGEGKVVCSSWQRDSVSWRGGVLDWQIGSEVHRTKLLFCLDKMNFYYRPKAPYCNTIRYLKTVLLKRSVGKRYTETVNLFSKREDVSSGLGFSAKWWRFRTFLSSDQNSVIRGK